MTKADEIEVNKLIHRLGLKYALKDSDIREIVESQFKFSYNEIRKLDLNENLDNIKTNFMFKYIGKIYIDNKIIDKIKNGKQEEF